MIGVKELNQPAESYSSARESKAHTLETHTKGKESRANYVSITVGYGERGLGIPGSDSAITSVLGTEFIWGPGSTAASAFCSGFSTKAGSGLASAGAGRALLLITSVGSSAFPIS